MIRCLVFLWLIASTAQSKELQMVSFNLESGDAKIETLAEYMWNTHRPIDIWAFQEVEPRWESYIIDTLNNLGYGGYKGVLGTTGRSDRLMIAYNTRALTLKDIEELHHINIYNRVRSPLAVTFKDTDSGKSLTIVNNHLYRSSSKGRLEQSHLLARWTKEQENAIIAIGDFNYDYNIVTGKRDPGFDALMKGSSLEWIKPKQLVSTHCSPHPTILDFVFTTIRSPSTSEILFPQDEYCPDNKKQSDHRPVYASIRL